MGDTAELEGSSPEDEPEIEASAESGAGPEAADDQSASPESVAQADEEPGLDSQMATLQAQADEYLDGWQRARAEFANYKKRVAREQLEARQRITGETLSKYLGVVDDLERALKDRPEDGDAAAWAEGIELIYRKLVTLLDSEGVEVIQAEGEPFDPTLHEALSHEESGDHQEGQVIEVIQPGYRMGERVLRPALVRVAK